MKRIAPITIAISLTLWMVFGETSATYTDDSMDLISVALSELDYQEGEDGFTKFGEWYDLPEYDWCDMFVSWCATQGNISKASLPHSVGCTKHVRLFSNKGRYQISAARGGTYIPKQGDIVFFYNYIENPKAGVVRHAGIVLCVENDMVFTIEGNTLTNRLDYSYLEDVFPYRDEEIEPANYVAVKCYPLNDKQIHGYGTPKYMSTNPYVHEGFVDLGQYSKLENVFSTLDAAKIMRRTSEYTFSPRYGMTRGDFLDMVMDLFGLSGWEESTQPFIDVKEDSTHYSAIMTARSAKIVDGVGNNRFCPNLYISGDAANAILSRAMSYVGMEEREFDFSEGDFSYLLTPYTIRADLAVAIYEIMRSLPIPQKSTSQILVEERSVDWEPLLVEGAHYVQLEKVCEEFDCIRIVEHQDESIERANSCNTESISKLESAQLENPQHFFSDESIEQKGATDTKLPLPLKNTDRVRVKNVALSANGNIIHTPSFESNHSAYIKLRSLAELLQFEIEWDEVRGVVTLTHEK